MADFESVSDEVLDDIARAIDAAAGEGETPISDLAEMVQREYVRRGREIPYAFDRGTTPPERWRPF